MERKRYLLWRRAPRRFRLKHAVGHWRNINVHILETAPLNAGTRARR